MIEVSEWPLPVLTALPRSPGTYLLDIPVAAPLMLHVSRHGAYTLAPGRYVYVGSARGPGGLAGRVGRHLNPARKLHWHVDTLTALAPVARVYAVASADPLECAWVRWLLAQPGSAAPIPGFGSSDCREACPAHLLRIAADLDPGAWQAEGWESN